jgi:signal peptidase I
MRAPAGTPWQRLALLRQRTLPTVYSASTTLRRYSRGTADSLKAAAVLAGRIPAVPARLRQSLAMIANLALSAMAGAVLFALAASLAPRLLGYSSVIVYGGSMGDTVPVGSVAVAEDVQPDNISVGDIIIFYPPTTSPDRPPLMHRVVSIREENGQRLFHTKGDGNAAPDPWEMGIEGHGSRVVYSVPYVGYLMNLARSPLGWALFLLLPAAYLGSTTLSRIWTGKAPDR